MKVVDYTLLAEREAFFYKDGEMFYEKNGQKNAKSKEIKLCKPEGRICKFCSEHMTKVFCTFSEGKIGDPDESFTSIRIYECLQCGWWVVEDSFTHESIGRFFYDDQVSIAIVRKFDITDAKIPIQTLKREIKKSPNSLYNISPRKLEELVAHIYGQFYNCEAIHCGQPHDGGVDVILINSDTPILIQVKRRADPKYVEPILIVREFLGALLIEKSKHGIFVSTARDFSKVAQKTIKNGLNNRVVEFFELHNFDRLASILECTKHSEDIPWRPLANRLREEEEEVVVDFYKLFSN